MHLDFSDRAKRYSDDEIGHFMIQVKDNGIGILPENITKIFTHGFTTKKTGYGFGLHASALFAEEMNGSLHAESKGIGYGQHLL